MIEAVLFDLDKTLLKYEIDEDIDLKIIEYWLLQMGVFEPKKIMFSDDWKDNTKKMSYLGVDYETFMREWNPIFPQIEFDHKINLLSENKIKPYEGIYAFIQSLNVPKALVTNSSPTIVNFLLNNFGLQNSFDYIFTRNYDYKDLKKPEPEVCDMVLEKLGVPKSNRIMMIGDSMTDIEFARNSGITAVNIHHQQEDHDLFFKNIGEMHNYFINRRWIQ